MRVSFVVPVYRELSNRNLHGFLTNIAQQDFDPSLLDVAVIVNHSPEIAADMSSPIRAENLATLRALREARYPFSIVPVDLATQGYVRNMGKIRNLGIAEVAQLSPNPQNHIVVHMDCDTRFESNFVSTLVSAYAEGYDVVFARRSYELRGDASDLVDSHIAYAQKRAARDLSIFLSGYSEGFATYQISSRLSTLLQVGGFRPLAEGEDTQLTKDLLRFRHLLHPDVVVRTEDRARGDGFTSARRRPGKKERWFPARVLLAPLAQKLSEDVRAGVTDCASAQNHFGKQLERIFNRQVQADPTLAAQLREAAEFPQAVEVTMNDGQVATLDPFSALFRETVFSGTDEAEALVCKAFCRNIDPSEISYPQNLHTLNQTLARARRNPSRYPQLERYLNDLGVCLNPQDSAT